MREIRDSKGRVRIDEKHSLAISRHIEDREYIPYIVKSTNDQPIPDEEPRILFRGRDKLALPMLAFYRHLCEEDGATQYQLDTIDKMIKEFREFLESSSTMKQPGSTLEK